MSGQSCESSGNAFSTISLFEEKVAKKRFSVLWRGVEQLLKEVVVAVDEANKCELGVGQCFDGLGVVDSGGVLEESAQIMSFISSLRIKS